MNCKKAQQLFDDLAHNRLPETLASEVHKHLADCTDCRVQQQRSVRLLRLLAMKRYEHPSPDYFEGFHAAFYHRLAAEQRKPARWQVENIFRVLDYILNEWIRLPRFGFVGAIGFALAIGLLWNGFYRPAPPAVRTSQQQIPAQLTEAAGREPRSIPKAVVVTFPTGSVYPSLSTGTAALIPANTRTGAASPRYVLDHITITPVSHEVSDVQF